MAIKPCRECHAKVSSEAKTCPNCGIKNPVKKPTSILALILLSIILFIIFSPKNHNDNTPISKQKERESNYTKSCSTNYKLCKSNADIVNINTEVQIKSSAACKIEAESQAISEIDWGGFSKPNFSSFYDGDSGPRQNEITLIDDYAMYSNQFGVKIKKQTVCIYNLKDKKVTSLTIL